MEIWKYYQLAIVSKDIHTFVGISCSSGAVISDTDNKETVDVSSVDMALGHTLRCQVVRSLANVQRLECLVILFSDHHGCMSMFDPLV
jgi:hypothetical protein